MGGWCPTLESYRPWGCVSVVFLSWFSVVSLLYDLLPTAKVLMLRGCFLYPRRWPLMISSQYFYSGKLSLSSAQSTLLLISVNLLILWNPTFWQEVGGRGWGFFGDPRAGWCSLLPTAASHGTCSTEGIVSQSSPSLSGSSFLSELLHGCRNSPSFTFVHDRWV